MLLNSRRIRVLLAHLPPAPAPPPRPAVRATATAAAEEGAEPASLPDDFVHPTMRYRPRPWTKAQLDALRAADPPEHLIAIRGRVYDVTHFLDDHPGGGDVITELDDYADEEMTDAYDEAEHSEDANADLKHYYVGMLVKDDGKGGGGGEAAGGLVPVVPGMVLEEGPLPPEDGGDEGGGEAPAAGTAAAATAAPGADAAAAAAATGGAEDAEAAAEAAVQWAEVAPGAEFAFPPGGTPRTAVLRLLSREVLAEAGSGGGGGGGSGSSSHGSSGHGDMLRLRFGLPGGERQRLGLATGQHLQIVAPRLGGKARDTLRSYTPISLSGSRGSVDLVVRVYFSPEGAAAAGGGAQGDPRFPRGGLMSQYLHGLAVGDGVRVRGPRGRITYAGGGRFDVRARKVQATGDADDAGGAAAARVLRVLRARKVGMVAGGTGVTPMLQVINAVLHGDGSSRRSKRGADKTKLSLVYANRSPGDILCRPELERAVAAGKGQFRLWYTVDKLPAARDEARWKYSTGFVTKDLLAKHLPPPAKDTVILLCGPKPLVKKVCVTALLELGHREENILLF